jgi:hypothetical protein
VEGRTDGDKAGHLLEEALAIFREIGDGWGTSHALRRLEINLTLRGQYARTWPILEEALAGGAGSRGSQRVCLVSVSPRQHHLA